MLSRVLTAAFAALLLAGPALAHEGEHGLHLSDVRFVVRPLEGGQVLTFTVTNAPDAATSGLSAHVSHVGAELQEEHRLRDLGAGESRAYTLAIAARPTAYGCVSVGALGKASERVCATSDGVEIR